MSQPLAELMKARGLTPRADTFDAPWEARAFALAIALSDRDAVAWETFRERLIEAISAADKATAAGGQAPSYYECWLTALEDALASSKLVDPAELDRRAALIAANPPAPTRAIATGPIKIA